MDGSQVINPYLAGNFAPVRSEDDFELRSRARLPAGLAGAFYRNGPNPQFDAARRLPLVLRRRDDPRLLRRGRQGRATATAMCARPKWRARARRRPLAVRHLRQPDDHRPVGDRQGWRRRQHQHRLARRQAAGAGGGPHALRAGSRRRLESRGYADELPRQGHRPPEARSRDRRDGVVRLFGRRNAAERARCSYGVTDATGKVVRRDDFEAPFAAWSTTSW